MTRAYCASCGKPLVVTEGCEHQVKVQPCKHCLAEAAQDAIDGYDDSMEAADERADASELGLR